MGTRTRSHSYYTCTVFEKLDSLSRSGLREGKGQWCKVGMERMVQPCAILIMPVSWQRASCRFPFTQALVRTVCLYVQGMQALGGGMDGCLPPPCLLALLACCKCIFILHWPGAAAAVAAVLSCSSQPQHLSQHPSGMGDWPSSFNKGHAFEIWTMASDPQVRVNSREILPLITFKKTTWGSLRRW